jgi:hypothetical protein
MRKPLNALGEHSSGIVIETGTKRYKANGLTASPLRSVWTDFPLKPDSLYTSGINVSTLDSSIRNTNIPRDFINEGTETLDGSTVNPLLWRHQLSKFQLMFLIFFGHDSLKNNLN